MPPAGRGILPLHPFNEKNRPMGGSFRFGELMPHNIPFWGCRGRIPLPAGGFQKTNPYTNKLLMRHAAQAAPNPLSMLTTVTPLAHEVSMPSSAESPAKLAP